MNGKIRILQFGSKTCPPCVSLRYKLTIWLKDYPEIEYGYIDIEEAMEECAQMGILSVPTICVYVDNQLSIKESGYFSLDSLLVKVDRIYNLMR